MRRVMRLLLILAAAFGLLRPVAASAQEKAGDAAGVAFAPGVLTTIEPALDAADAISLHDVVEIRADKSLDWTPHSLSKSRTLYSMAKDAQFPLQVWCLELTFKPLRMIEVDVPGTDGRLERKLIWYLVYRVRNTGAGLDPQVQEDGTFVTKAAPTDKVRFQPEFVVSSQDRDAEGNRIRKAYLDRVIPAAMEPIRRREMPRGQLLTSIEIAEKDLPVESGRTERGEWGVAMWENIDPEMDFFSVFVGGLTNAYQWTDPAGAFKAGDSPGKGRQFVRKTLQLNFWRPGDELEQNEREIRLGPGPGKAEFYDSAEGVASKWVYR